ncbi:MAG: methyl-accepting chemotaxis protein [Acidobacteriota bacterium]
MAKRAIPASGSAAVAEAVDILSDPHALYTSLDHLGTNIFVADADLTLVFMNRKARETLTGMEGVIREMFGLSVDELVGGSIDRFHKGELKQRVRGILADHKNLPYRTTISVGPARLDLNVNGITDEGGALTGYIVNWEDVTDRERLDAEAARLQTMMDNIPINVMLADRDHTLVYMNPASIETLKKIEHLLPKPVDQLVGESIDIFHKNPEHQRRIVSDPKNLPHRAKIKLGPETLDLLVSAIYDRAGGYIGPMVTWNVITRQVELKERFSTDVGGVVSIVSSAATELQANSQNMSAAAEETSRQAQAVASASEQMTRNVQTVSASAEQLGSSIGEISKHVQDASSMAQSAVRKADETNATMAKLGQSSQEIGDVVKVITSIAQQTNLLALNATIEAARAGEAGKGFAVVANEVKELARQTAKATEEIGQKITGVQADTEQAVAAITEIGDLIGQLNETSTTVAAAVEEQNSATNEISRNVAEAATGASEVNENIANVSKVAEESGKTAEEIKTASTQLAAESEKLNAAVQAFLEDME